ncbi:fibronectin type III domain-containing protein [Radiobacillus kanasensis]|nr:fibronectin type III domain-containing protein [Radiobacillus kanasensis]
MTATTVDLDWDAIEDASGYDVFVDGVLEDSVTTNSYTVSGLTTATDYDIYVVATNSKYGTESAPSNTVTVTTA